jgi:hypothetical protein
MLQIRPREVRPERRTPFYNPERDIGYIGMGLVRASVFAHDAKFQEPWYKQFLEDHGLTEDDIDQGLMKLAEACRQIIDAPNPPAALDAVGFSALPPAVQLAIYGKLGQVFLAATWGGVKDVKDFQSGTPAEVLELADTIEAFIAPGAVVRDGTISSSP